MIAENVRITGVEVEISEANALTADYEELFGNKVDIVVSNPPYIPYEDKLKMSANVLDYEPEMALFVENHDPLIFYREILESSTGVLNKGGWVYFEIHEDLSSGVYELFEEMNFVNIEVRKDLQGKDRMVRGKW